MTWKTKNRLNSVLGLTLSDGQLRAVQVARSKATIKVVNSVSAALSLDLLDEKPELIGREIRNHLDAAGIHEHACVVAVPANWIMSQHTKTPVLSPEDLDSFLQLEAEKGFPYDAAQLQIARSIHRSADGTYVTQLAVRKDRLELLAAVAKAARLKPVSFTLGLAALPGVIASQGKGRITVAVESTGATLLVSAGGGIAAFRTCEAAIESAAGENLVDGGAVSRELRVTFEQVPTDLRGDLRELCLCGDAKMVDQLAGSLREWPDTVGLKVETGGPPGNRLADQIAEGIANHWLTPTGSEVEFLPPRPGRWSLLMARYNSKRLATAGLALGGAVVLALVAFGWQEIRLQLLRSEWRGMQVRAGVLTEIQDRIRDYRPWYDRSFPDLRILARVTQCFPDNGSVTARSFDIHHVANVTTVNITGTAQDDRALLRTQDQLRKAREIQGLKVESISGKIPAQFTFTFRWIGGSGS
jgi:GAF domain-containing protein